MNPKKKIHSIKAGEKTKRRKFKDLQRFLFIRQKRCLCDFIQMNLNLFINKNVLQRKTTTFLFLLLSCLIF